jgi:predicted TIM-barrel fold metal-dependent hydrolase
MDRRGFIASGLAAGAVVWPSTPGEATDAVGEETSKQTDDLGINAIPIFCSHEHWGSINSIGQVAEGFRADVYAGAKPKRKTTLLDLIVDPYFSGCLHGAGIHVNQTIQSKLGESDLHSAALKHPAKVLEAIREALRVNQFVGTYQCIRRGIVSAYGYDINEDGASAIRKADKAIANNYGRIFEWYRQLMQKAHFSELIRPVHPEFYVRQENVSSAQQELAFTHTIMRIDPLLDLWKLKSSRRDGLAEIAGVEPVDAVSWRKFLDKIFHLAETKGSTGIKQLQAYHRNLHFESHRDNEVKFRGELNSADVNTFKDWVVHECCKRAHDRGWPHQVHVGTHNMPHSDPLPLQHLARRYPRQKIVMIHCWPYLEEAGFLAKYLPNMYIDTCWQPVLSPQFFRQAMLTWLQYVPVNKIMMGNDATSIEMAVGSSMFTREILGETLQTLRQTTGVTTKDLRRAAADMLHNNAVAVYGIGKRFEL